MDKWTTRPDPTRPDQTPKGSGSGSAPVTPEIRIAPENLHGYVDDGTGASCDTCGLPEHNPQHVTRRAS